MAPHKIMLSVVFAGQNVGVKQVGDRIWLGRLLGDSRGSPCSPIAAVGKPGSCGEGRRMGAVANSQFRPEPDGRALSSTMYAQNAAEAGPNVFAAALRFN